MISHIAAVVLLTFAFLAAGIDTYAATLVVTKTADTADGTCDSDCSLREVVAQNALALSIKGAVNNFTNWRIRSTLLVFPSLINSGA